MIIKFTGHKACYREVIEEFQLENSSQVVDFEVIFDTTNSMPIHSKNCNETRLAHMRNNPPKIGLER